ncbi:MAG: hypothetical protein RLZZ118_384 [Bacteroidota bacterium]|jgi:hypothetical protein
MNLNKSPLIVLVFAFAICLIFSSSETGLQGVSGAANSGAGCGSCHGASSTNTIITLEGFPTSGYIPGVIYPLTLKIKNSTRFKTGFDIAFSSGTISGNPSGTIVSGSEMHHSNAFTASSGVTTIQFNWTAPLVSFITVNIAANATDNDLTFFGDEWSNKQYIIYKANIETVKNLSITKLEVSPNPTSSEVQFVSENKIESIYLVNNIGQFAIVSFIKNKENIYSVYLQDKPAGKYLLFVKYKTGFFYTTIIKV